MIYILLLLSLVSAKVFVLGPEELVDEVDKKSPGHEIKSSLANFGNPPYGSYMIGRLYRTTFNETLACSPLDSLINIDDESRATAIVLVERGECPFVMKVQHAQEIGAKAVLIMDNKDGEDVEKMVMADNGTGGNISIPSFLISKADGEMLKRFLDNEDKNSNVQVKLSFDLDVHEKVDFKIFYSSGNQKIRLMLHEFEKTAKKFDKSLISFEPHFVTFRCRECAEDGYSTAQDDCVSGGRYCYTDPDNNGRLTGRDIVKEDLRSLCIWKETESEPNYNRWFDYTRHHAELCNTSDHSFTDECAMKQMKKSGIDKGKVIQCMEDSVEGDDIAIDDNTMLREQKEIWRQLRFGYHPIIVINDQVYRGDLEAEELTLALCAGFTNPPDFCPKPVLPDKKEEVDYKTDDSEKESSDTWWIILTVAVVCIVTIGLILIVYRVWMKKDIENDMKSQINMAVSQYFTLSEGSGNQDRPLVQANYV